MNKNRNDNKAILALKKIQEKFQGEAKRLNLKDDSDIVELIKNFRKDKGKLISK